MIYLPAAYRTFIVFGVKWVKLSFLNWFFRVRELAGKSTLFTSSYPGSNFLFGPLYISHSNSLNSSSAYGKSPVITAFFTINFFSSTLSIVLLNFLLAIVLRFGSLRIFLAMSNSSFISSISFFYFFSITSQASISFLNFSFYNFILVLCSDICVTRSFCFEKNIILMS